MKQQHLMLNIFSQGLDYTWLFNNLCNNYLSYYNNQEIVTDGLLLIQDGVYFFRSNILYNNYLDKTNITNINSKFLLLNLYVLKIDLESRGLIDLVNNNKIKLISYEEFVDLVIKYEKNILW